MTRWDTADLEALLPDELLAVARRVVSLLVERLSPAHAVEEFTSMTVPTSASDAESAVESGSGPDWGSMLGGLGGPDDQPSAPGVLRGQAPEPPSDAGDAADVEPDPLALPRFHASVEALSRTSSSLQTSLAGHTDRLFALEADREDKLGIPVGKCAFRDAADYLHQHLRIPRREARQRVRRAHQLRERRPMLSGEPVPPRLPELAEADREGAVDSVAIDAVGSTLADARDLAERSGADTGTVEEIVRNGERTLTAQARTLDPDAVRKVCDRFRQWTQAVLMPDGDELTDGQLQLMQGFQYAGKRHGLHRWTIAADDLQHEILLTVANAATNPRAGQSDAGGSGDNANGEHPAAGEGSAGGALGAPPATARQIDSRTRPQKQLGGLVSALQGALSLLNGNGLPSTGGIRPQVLVTMDYATLLGQWQRATKAGGTHAVDSDAVVDTASGAGAVAGAGDEAVAGAEVQGDPTARSQGGIGPSGQAMLSEAAFSGPVSPATIRTLACDAEIIPTVLGGEGELLDVGRGQRLFSPRLRRAIIARDGGCAAPGCSMPAPWCEVHHVRPWERGGGTSVRNGVLLCSHHHHGVHAGAWHIDSSTGRPRFIPASYLDPARQPQRNHHWRW